MTNSVLNCETYEGRELFLSELDDVAGGGDSTAQKVVKAAQTIVDNALFSLAVQATGGGAAGVYVTGRALGLFQADGVRRRNLIFVRRRIVARSLESLAGDGRRACVSQLCQSHVARLLIAVQRPSTMPVTLRPCVTSCYDFRAFGASKLNLLMILKLAGEPGFEPRQTESESVVLPLHHSPTHFRTNSMS
jgi:hypothetical protein